MSRPFSLAAMSGSFLVVGLGNPGPEYAGNRHNVGFMAVDHLADRFGGAPWGSRWRGEATCVPIADAPVWLLKPATFMNASGIAVAAALADTGIPLERLCVIHDDLDLPCGRLKVSHNRGAAGHNGIRSIIDTLDSKGFSRVRIGIGRPAPGCPVVEHVLGDFAADEQRAIAALLPVIAAAVETLVRFGVTAAMNRFNRAMAAPEASAPADSSP